MAAMVAALLLAACQQQAANSEAKQNANPEKYSRDRQLCLAQVDDYMRNRRNVDESRRDVFRGESDRFGQSQLPDSMAAYGDSKTSDRMMERCMEARGWAQPQKPWWQRIAS
jgi:hypothetical protein